jgi:predicted RNA binding protein YcfA (HicA-like mRNA interferase family)
MPKLPAVSPQKLARALERDGFVLKRVRGSHYTYYHPVKDCVVVVPFHGKDVPKGILCRILRDADIPKEKLQDLL